MSNIGEYSLFKYPSSRVATFDVCEIGRKKHAMQALVEIDVTKARKLIRQRKKEGINVSFNAWLLKCIGCICDEYKIIHGVKKGRRNVVVFDDTDISIIVEREINGKNVPLPYVIRKVNEKSISEILQEIRTVQKQPINDEGDYVLGGNTSKAMMKAYYNLPGFIRRFFISRIIKSPKLTKEQMGTVVVTSLGMMGKFNGWIIPISIHPLTFAVGSIIKKPTVVNDTIEIREHLFLTVLVDHDIVDGAPAARALSKLIKLLENGYGLDTK